MKTAYSQGDYIAICDRCGMKRKASTMSVDWKGMFACPQCYETRHPQDFVKGLPDDQTVPISRPTVEQVVGETTLSNTAYKNAVSITLTSITGLRDKDSIGILMDNDIVHWSYIDGVPSTSIVLIGSYLPYDATSGNTVYLPSLCNESFVTATMGL